MFNFTNRGVAHWFIYIKKSIHMNSSLYGYTSYKCGHKQNWFDSAKLIKGPLVPAVYMQSKRKKNQGSF